MGRCGLKGEPGLDRLEGVFRVLVLGNLRMVTLWRILALGRGGEGGREAGGRFEGEAGRDGGRRRGKAGVES